MNTDLIDQLIAVAREAGLDAIALAPGVNFKRTFGRDFHQSERPVLVIIPVDGRPAAIAPELEAASFSEIGLDATVSFWRDQDGYEDAFQAAGRAVRANRIGVEGQRMRVFEYLALSRAFPNAEIVDAQKQIAALRLSKTQAEVTALRRAIDISEQALGSILGDIRVGMTEKQVEALLQRAMFDGGAEGLAFNPIVAAGDNSHQPHASARHDYQIQPGDALLFDFGARFGGMCADITRTFFVGECADEDRAFYETVKDANEVGFQASGPGVRAEQIDDAVQCFLEASDFAQYIVHKTGHGLGLEVHEDPHIMRGNTAEMTPGMVFTIEPGLYRPGRLGVRIEDDVLVTPQGAERLTNFSRELTVIGL